MHNPTSQTYNFISEVWNCIVVVIRGKKRKTLLIAQFLPQLSELNFTASGLKMTSPASFYATPKFALTPAPGKIRAKIPPGLTCHIPRPDVYFPSRTFKRGGGFFVNCFYYGREKNENCHPPAYPFFFRVIIVCEISINK